MNFLMAFFLFQRNYVKCLKRECKIRSRIHACLFCEYFGCFKVHIQSHSKKKNHSLSMSLIAGNCFHTVILKAVLTVLFLILLIFIRIMLVFFK